MSKLKLLVATDFSQAGRNAVNYAIELAAAWDAELVVMHSIEYQDDVFKRSREKEEENTERFNKAKDQLDNEISYIKNRIANPVKEILEGGPANLSVASVIDMENIDYIVVGTEGISGLKSRLLGSFTNNVLTTSSCPVFTIPSTTRYKPINHIVCLTGIDISETDALKHTIEIARRTRARITFFNVTGDEEEQQGDFVKFKEMISTLSEGTAFDFIMFKSKDILGSIDHFVNEKEPDLVITLGKERSFFEKLFGKKVTKKLSIHTTFPLLSFPSHQSKDSEKGSKKSLRKSY